MKKNIAVILVFAVFIALVAGFILSRGAWKDTAFKSTDIKLFINGEKQKCPVLESEDGAHLLVPVADVMKAAGRKVTRKGNDILFSKADGGKNPAVWVRFDSKNKLNTESKLYYYKYLNDETQFLKEDFSDSSTLTYYAISDNELFTSCDILKEFESFYITRDGSELHIDFPDYYKENVAFYKTIGKKLTSTVFVNSKKTDTPVYYNSRVGLVSDGEHYFVELKPIISAVGMQIELEGNKITIIKRNGGTAELFACNVRENGLETSYGESASKDVYILDGKPYASISEICNAIGANYAYKDNNENHIYTKDYVREDIPLTLKEAYEYFDKAYTKEEKEKLMSSADDGESELHASLVMWIKNNWIRPAPYRIAKKFLDKGINNPDDISSYIIEGYIKHLKGESAGFEDIVKDK